MPLDIIGTGLGRTGTRTLKAALETLGCGAVYHMTNLFQSPDGLAHWERAAVGADVDWEVLFDGYRGVVDFPGALFWRTLVDRYPSARVIHTTRPPEDWYESAAATIYPAVNGGWTGTTQHILQTTGQWIWGDLFEGRFEDRRRALEIVAAHEAAVLEAVSADRLLVYQVTEGWEPLARFLGVDVPTEPFPSLNTRQDFVARRDANR